MYATTSRNISCISANNLYIFANSFVITPSCAIVIPCDKYISCASLNAFIISSIFGRGIFLRESINAFSSNNPLSKIILPPSGSAVVFVMPNFSNASLFAIPLCLDLFSIITGVSGNISSNSCLVICSLFFNMLLS